MQFDSINLYAKYPLPVKEIKKGLSVRVKSAVITPNKNVLIDDVEINYNKKVEETLQEFAK